MGMLVDRARNARVELAWAKIGLMERPFPIRAEETGRLAVNRIPDCLTGLSLEVGADALFGVADSDSACLVVIDPPNLRRKAVKQTKIVAHSTPRIAKVDNLEYFQPNN
jgi:hypothetical protein